MEKISLNCLICHPTMDPTDITNCLKLTPNLTQKSGETIVTPAGTEPGGEYTYSKWSYVLDIKPGRALDSELISLLNHLYKSREFLVGLSDEGGHASVFFSLTSPLHQAFSMTADMMAKMTEMKIEFGFEIFADQNP